VLMALLTTLMTGPLLSRIGHRDAEPTAPERLDDAVRSG